MATLLATLPNFNGLINAAWYHVWQAPVEIETGGEVLVRVERLETARVRDVPDTERLVVRRRQQVAAARVPGRAAHPVVVTHQRRQALSRAHVPDLDGFITWAAGEEGSGVVGAAVVGAGRLVDGGGRGLRRPRHALHYVLVFT